MSPLILPERRLLPELIDTVPVGSDQLRACLSDLAWVNAVTGAYRPTLTWLDRLRRRQGRSWSVDRPLRVLDVGSGYGDMLRRIADWAARNQVPVALTGIDCNPAATLAATAATPPGLPITYLTADLFAFETGIHPDVVISSLFTHHLDDSQLVGFLRWMEDHARLGWYVNDLERSRLCHFLVYCAVRVVPLHWMVIHDAPVSVVRAFAPADWQRLLAEAGIRAARIESYIPYRLCVGHLK